MKYASAAAFRTALEQRLRNHSREAGLGLSRLRKIIVFERLLARFVQVTPDRWILKGGLALDFRLGEGARATKDMDLARHDDKQAALEDLIAAQNLDLDDFFVLRSERVGPPGPDGQDAAVRYRIHAELAGRPFETVLLDIGFSDPELWEPERVRATALLEFADLHPVDVPVLPLEQHLAEKVHAYTREYSGNRPSSRVKDLVDMVVIASFRQLDAERLRTALRETFDARGTHLMPESLPRPPDQWVRPYARLARELDLPQPDWRVSWISHRNLRRPTPTPQPYSMKCWVALQGVTGIRHAGVG